ncbi:cytochrome P450 2F2 isoform X2 [Camelus bactrianus]|uniref:Cytochrome P450 2F2 isoform X2 n=1 Tax=Camelus bactrianus TaxID=9837 RepID=A0AC58QTX5_CAMBA
MLLCFMLGGEERPFCAASHVVTVGLDVVNSSAVAAWGLLYKIFPSLLDWLPGPHRCLFQNFGRMKDLIARSVRDHQATLDPESPRDFIDCFLTKIAQEKQDPLSHFHMDTLLMTTHNLIFGGTETVGTTLRHAFLVLLKYPKVQARVQEEIDRVVGRERLPALEDRASMPYTDAVIHEVQRFADIIPMSLPHRVIRDTAFRGSLLPKGTDIITLLNTVHCDPSQFLTPQEFNPDHFLDASQSFKKSPAFVPFSAAGAHGALPLLHPHPAELLSAAAGGARGHRPDSDQLGSRQFAAAFPAAPARALTPHPFQIRLGAMRPARRACSLSLLVPLCPILSPSHLLPLTLRMPHAHPPSFLSLLGLRP